MTSGINAINNESRVQDGGMTQEVKAFAVKPDDLSSTPRVHQVDQENWVLKIVPHFQHTHTIWHAPPLHLQINAKTQKQKATYTTTPHPQGSGDRTHVLTLTGQVLYPVSYLYGPSTSVHVEISGQMTEPISSAYNLSTFSWCKSSTYLVGSVWQRMKYKSGFLCKRLINAHSLWAGVVITSREVSL